MGWDSRLKYGVRSKLWVGIGTCRFVRGPIIEGLFGKFQFHEIENALVIAGTYLTY